MNLRPHPSQPERQAEHAVRVCVPPGFFERLTSTCDFRAITQPFFSLYDLRPQSSESDPILYFKILLLEYILEVSSDAFRSEFTSHSGLRVFLNIDDRTILPAPGEIVYFRRALGWMAFKSLLERVIREAIKNGLSERDCAILEKRYNRPLVELVKEPPPEEYGTAIISPSNIPAPNGVGLNPSDEAEVPIPPFSELSLSELFERIIVPDPPPPIQMVKNPAHAESTLHAAAQMLWGGQPGNREPASDAGIPPANSGVSTKQGMSSSSPIQQGDQEIDPLGIESFLDGTHPVSPGKAARSLGTSGRQESYSPPLRTSLDGTSSAPRRELPRYGASSSRLQAFYDQARAKKESPREGQGLSDMQLPSRAEGNAKGSASRLQRIEPIIEERMEDRSGDALTTSEAVSPVSPVHPMKSSQSPPAPKEVIRSEKHLSPAQKGKVPFSTVTPSSRRSSLLSAEFLSRSLYIAVPILVLLAVYLLIGILKNVQPGPATVESAQPASVLSPHPISTQASGGSGPLSSAQPEQSSNSLRGNAKASPEAPRPGGVAVGSTIKVPEGHRSAQAGDGVSEEPKKLTLIRHLRVEHGLDFSPSLYRYRELKDIDDRLEETLKKAANR